LPLAVVVFDGFQRGERIAAFEGVYRLTYAGALLESAVVWGLLLYAAGRRRGALRWLSAVLFVFFVTFTIGGQSYFYDQYHAYLNVDVSLFASNFADSVVNQLFADIGNYLAAKAPPLVVALGLVFLARRWLRPRRAAVRQAVWSVDRNTPIAEMQPLTTLLMGSLGRPRLLATLLLVFASVGLAIVLSGVYGVVAYTSRRRERELGIRLALGARPQSIGALVIFQGGAYALAGLAIGLPIALALTGFMRSLLFGVQPRDPATFAGLCALVGTAAIGATVAPALRAQRIDPAAVLKGD